MALKVLSGPAVAFGNTLARFEREATMASRFAHPGIAAVYDIGVRDGLAWIAMQYVEGETLAARIHSVETPTEEEKTERSFRIEIRPDPGGTQSKALAAQGPPGSRVLAPDTRSDLVRVVEEAAGTLHAAHEAGIIHRDVKPANIMITPEGRPVLLDFGLALSQDSNLPGLTETGGLVGTLQYMSPEQVSGSRVSVDRRTDVWSLGVTLYEALTQRRPFDAPTREGLIRAIMEKEPDDPRRLVRGIGRDLAVVIATALEKEPSRRYSSALAFAEDLGRVLRMEPVLARPAGPLVRLGRWYRRKPGLAASVTAAFIFLVAGVLGTGLTSAAERAQRIEYQRLADARVLEDLKREAREDLWPARPELLPALRNWRDRALRLVANLDGHVRALEALRASAVPYDLDQRREDEPEELKVLRNELVRVESYRGSLHESIADEELRREAEDEAASRIRALRCEVEELERSLPVRRRWRFQDTTTGWRHDKLEELVDGLRTFLAADPFGETLASVERRIEVASSIREKTVTEHARLWDLALARMLSGEPYRGLHLQPVVGLVPLGFGPEGLAEFLVSGTGTEPQREQEAGRLIAEETTGVVLVLVPGGVFRMGSDRDDPASEADERLHRVRLDAYFIGKWEVTQHQWLSVMGTNPSFHRDGSPDPFGQRSGPPLGPGNPVESVSWFAAADFARRLGLRLPIEAEWEFGCRAGTETAYFWGRDGDSIAGRDNVFDRTGLLHLGVPEDYPRADFDDGCAVTARAGTFPPNAWGLHDMHGNVAEWCADAFAPYEGDCLIPGAAFRDGPSSSRRVYRGGSYIVPPSLVRSARRFNTQPTTAERFLGFRVAACIEIR